MALKKTVDDLKKYLHEISFDLEKAGRGNKAASQRVRTNTIQFSKIAKLYRKESIKEGRKVTKKSTATKKKSTAAKKKSTAAKKKSTAAKKKPSVKTSTRRKLSLRKKSSGQKKPLARRR